ncbi:hypothetical protein F4809DRAFT_347582 [Biscogniauxia mediterranea]|nr:hypothetical protein F4809DRAFT_347582 [Biscogniauxia mediterranea]
MEQFEFHAYPRHPGTGEDRRWAELEPGIEQMTPERGRRGGPADGPAAVAGRRRQRPAELRARLRRGDLRRRGRPGGYPARRPVSRPAPTPTGSRAWTHGPFYSEKGCLMFIVILPDGKVKS